MANTSFCIIHRYPRWEEISSRERALHPRWIGCGTYTTPPILNVIYCIWDMLRGHFIPLKSIHFPVEGWPVFDLGEIWSIATGRSSPLSKIRAKPPFILCLSFPRTTHCCRTYLCLQSFIVKNNGGSCGHGAWTTVVIPLSLGLAIVISPRRCW